MFGRVASDVSCVSISIVYRPIRGIGRYTCTSSGIHMQDLDIIIRLRRSRSAEAVIKLSRGRSLGLSVGLYVRRSVQCIVEKQRIGSGCRLGS